MSEWKQWDEKYIWHPFSPLASEPPLAVERGEGAYLVTTDGRKILDVISSWWVNIHGHAHPEIASAITEQVHRLEQVIFAGFAHEPAAQLSATLMSLLPDDQSKVFFSDDGSTSTEVAIKLSLQYWYNQGQPRRRILAMDGAYHGDTFGAMAVGDRSSIFNQPFVHHLFEVDYLPFPEGDGSNTLEAMDQLASTEHAAFIFEPLVQGAGGMRMYSATLLDKLIQHARSQEIICIADEVMTGFGRTGRMFACDHLQTQPDIFCLSKGITGGFLPMGVTTVNDKVAHAFDSKDKHKAFFHGHSYTANPLACAAANASMRLLLTEEVQQSIARIGQCHASYLRRRQPNKHVLDARQTGTILAIELKVDDGGYTSTVKDRIYRHFLDRNLLLRPLGHVIYVLPPYVITDEELQWVYSEIDAFLDDLLTLEEISDVTVKTN
ncbi:MAG: adenosylmethionine--8-amino-7-oxononanoate transaminase [Bacteroidota bacterium]